MNTLVLCHQFSIWVYQKQKINVIEGKSGKLASAWLDGERFYSLIILQVSIHELASGTVGI